MTDALFSAPNLSLPERRDPDKRRLQRFFPWSTDPKIVDGIEELLAPSLAQSLPEEELALLREVRQRIAEELRFEEETDETMRRLREETERVEGVWDLLPLQAWFRDIATGYFARRSSPTAFHSLCADFRDLLLLKVVDLAGEHAPSGRFAWFTLGKTARREGYPPDREDLLLVFDSNETGPFADYRRRVDGLLADLSIAGNGSPRFRDGSLAHWRGGLLDDLFSSRDETSPDLFADLRPLAGDAGLAETFLNLIRGGIDLHREALRSAARRTSTLPLAVGFLGFLRVEKTGRFRGGVDLERYAIEPLAANVRMMAIQRGVRETGTLQRLRRLLETGGLDVAAAADLSAAFQTFHRIALKRKAETGWRGGDEGRFVFPDLLTEEETTALREGLEAVGNLEKRIYSAAAHE